MCITSNPLAVSTQSLEWGMLLMAHTFAPLFSFPPQFEKLVVGSSRRANLNSARHLQSFSLGDLAGVGLNRLDSRTSCENDSSLVTLPISMEVRCKSLHFNLGIASTSMEVRYKTLHDKLVDLPISLKVRCKNA